MARPDVSWLRGSFVALVTPFREGKVDLPALDALVDLHASAGTAGLVPCGTTGESPTLSHEEHRAVVARVCEKAKGRLPVIAGTGSNSTDEAIALTAHAREAGAQGVLLVSPYYNRPTQDGLFEHFKRVSAAAGNLPVVLYNIPSRTGQDVLAPTVERLHNEVENVVAIKEATGSVDRTSDLLDRCPELVVLSGDDSLTLPLLAVGGRGVISVTANILPGLVASLVGTWERGDQDGALKIHRKIYALSKALFLETNPIPVKWAMARLGWIADEIRLPLTKLSAQHHAKVEDVLAGVGLLAKR
jgi:4-hydroxy-tetrahydrodipicolinate synthase